MKESASECRRVQVNEIECKWMKESVCELKRVQVNERENASEWKSARVRKSERGKDEAQNMELNTMAA